MGTNKGTGYDKYFRGWKDDGDPPYSRQTRNEFAIKEGLKDAEDYFNPPYNDYVNDPCYCKDEWCMSCSYPKRNLPKKKSKPKSRCTDGKRHTYEWVEKIQGWGSYSKKFERYDYEGPYSQQECSKCGKQGKRKTTQEYREAYRAYYISYAARHGYSYYYSWRLDRYGF